MVDRFADRRDAGQVLATMLDHYAGRADTIVLGLPRGGVPVAYEVALALRLPLDIVLVRKLGVPGHEELAMGAVASGGARFLNSALIRELRIPDSTIDDATRRELREIDRRSRDYRDGRPEPDLAGRVVILVDDGLATGATMLAAVEALHRVGPRRMVVAVPVGSPEACADVAAHVDEAVCAVTPPTFHAVGMWFGDFEPTTDDEVRDLLHRASLRQLPPPPTDPGAARFADLGPP